MTTCKYMKANHLIFVENVALRLFFFKLNFKMMAFTRNMDVLKVPTVTFSCFCLINCLIIAGRVDRNWSGRTARWLFETQSPIRQIRTRGADPGTGHGIGQDLLQESGPG